jgi:hypothetical protein
MIALSALNRRLSASRTTCACSTRGRRSRGPRSSRAAERVEHERVGFVADRMRPADSRRHRGEFCARAVPIG